MSDERLAATIRDGQRYEAAHGVAGGEITVEIKADATRERDFEDIREAVKEVLDR